MKVDAGPARAPGPGRPGGAGPAPPAAYSIPIYRQAEAARILGIPRSTLREWTGGCAGWPGEPDGDDGGRLVPGTLLKPAGLVTVAVPVTRRGPTIPFVGLAEAFVLASLRQAGIPMQRIRPAIRRLEEELGPVAVLASDRLRADRDELLWDWRPSSGDGDRVGPDDGDLVVVRSGQLMFGPAATAGLRRVTYRDGWARSLTLGQGPDTVIVDPLVNRGQPVPRPDPGRPGRPAAGTG
jgi:Putative DNA-binding HTH domain